MKYFMLDEPKASNVITNFLDDCKKHDIPISSLQISSGYTVVETESKTRNVFIKNRQRFPGSEAFIAECHKRDVRLSVNVNPFVLKNRLECETLANMGAFTIDSPTGNAVVTRLRSAGGESGLGSHLGMTGSAVFGWSHKGCKELYKSGLMQSGMITMNTISPMAPGNAIPI